MPNPFTYGILSLQYICIHFDIVCRRGVKRMKRLWQKVAQWVYAYGVQGAGAPSYRGAYEAPVPKALRK